MPIEDKTAPVKENIKLETPPVIKTNTKLFKSAMAMPSLYPKTDIVIKTTIFESPSLAPGTGIGRGICDSKSPRTSPNAVKRERKTHFFVFNLTSHPNHFYQNLIPQQVCWEGI